MSEKNILLADNNRDVLEVFQTVFNPPDYSLKIAKTSSDALAQVFTTMPDIVVIDGDSKAHDGPEVLRTLRANSATSGIPALIILPEDRAEIRKLYDSSGACDYVIKPITPAKIKMEIESLIKGRNLFGCKMNSKIISFCGARGGSGVTTIAVNTAIALHELGKSVILLEHANYFSGIRPALSLRTRRTVPLLMSENRDNLTPEHVMSFIEEHSSGIKALPTIAGIADMEKMDADSVQFMRFNLCPTSEYSVIDAGYGLNEAALELFDISDIVVFVSTLDLISLYNLEMIAQVFEGTRINKDKCMVIFNHLHAQGEIPENSIKDLKLKMNNLGFIPNHSAGFLKAINNGQPYLELFPRSPSARVIRSIAEKVHEMLGVANIKTVVA